MIIVWQSGIFDGNILINEQRVDDLFKQKSLTAKK